MVRGYKLGNRIAKKLATQTTNTILDYDKRGQKVRKQKGPGCLLLVLSLLSIFCLAISLVFVTAK